MQCLIHTYCFYEKFPEKIEKVYVLQVLMMYTIWAKTYNFRNYIALKGIL